MQISILQKKPDSEDLLAIRLVYRDLEVTPDEAGLAFRVLTHSVAALKQYESAPGLNVEAWLRSFVAFVLECETPAQLMAAVEVIQEQYLGRPIAEL